MINKETAYNLALEYLNKNPKLEIAILDDKTIETEYGWIFAYDSKKWVETKIGGYRIVGNYPILVEKLDSSIRTVYQGLRHDATYEEYLEQKSQINKLRFYLYLNLNDFLSGYMREQETARGGFPDIESAVEYYVRYNKPQEINKVIGQGQAKLAEKPFEWKSINECTDRHFKNAEEARKWLEKVIFTLDMLNPSIDPTNRFFQVDIFLGKKLNRN